MSTQLPRDIHHIHLRDISCSVSNTSNRFTEHLGNRAAMQWASVMIRSEGQAE
jgi:hypothetical protein